MDAAFAVDGVIAEKTGGEFLFEGGIREKITGDLPDGEVVVGEVAVDGIDDPITPRPHGAFFVALETIGVGVAGGIEPGPGEAFAKGGVGEELIDEFFPGVGGGIVDEVFHFLGSGWEAAEVEGEAADEGVFLGVGREGEVFFFQAAGDEFVDGVKVGGEGWLFDGGVGPVFFVFGTLGDPSVDEFFFFRGKFEV